MTDGTRLRLRAVPVDLYDAMVDQHESMVRECSLVALAADAGVVPPSDQLLRVARDVRARYRPIRALFDGDVDAARRRGEPSVDVDVVPWPGLVDDIAESVGLLDELDQLCADEQLLVTPSPPDVAALRHWIGDEVRRQLTDGAEPSLPPASRGNSGQSG
jgi:hypothetical protein